MTDQTNNPIDRELREQEVTETSLSQIFTSIIPPAGAKERLLGKLNNTFTESMLTLDDGGPYSFEEAAALAKIDEVSTDLLAAGLETEPEDGPIDEDDLDDED